MAKDELQTAKDLFECIAVVLGRTARGAISLAANYYEIGGNSLNSIVIVTQMNEKGYTLSKLRQFDVDELILIRCNWVLGISDFISAANLEEVLRKMKTSDIRLCNKVQTSFSSEPLQRQHRDVVLE